MSQTTCPITGSDQTEHLVSYERCVTSDNRLIDAPVENRISRASGLVFNASGARERVDEFYTDDYELHAESAVSEFMQFDRGGARGIYDNIVSFIEEGVSLPETGRLLDIGCGKGLLLRRFLDRHPGWSLAAVEPSRNARSYFAEVMPGVDVFEGPFEDSPFASDTFDLVTLNGVAEHVPDPVDFLTRVRACLAPDGVAYIGVPNFENNPADLFTYDHLSRFTPATLGATLDVAGLDTVHELAPPSRVPMWRLVRGSEPKPIDAEALYENARALVDGHLGFIDRMFGAYQRCAEDAVREGEKIGMYATGTIGLLGSVYTELKPELLESVYDDNSTVWGSQRLGRPIKDPTSMIDDGVRRMVISANPCYIDAISGRIREIAGDRVTVYAP